MELIHTYIATADAVDRLEVSLCAGRFSWLKLRFLNEKGRHVRWLGGECNYDHGRFQCIQFLDKLMPSLRVPLGSKRLFEIGEIGEKVPAQSVRDGFAARFV